MREKLSNIAGGALAFFVLYTSAFGAFEGLIQRAVFLILVIILGFTMYPMFKTPVRHGWAVAAFEAVLGVCSVLACVRVIMNYEHIILNLPAAEPLDIACTAILLLTILELCRRTVGWIFTSIIIAALAVMIAAAGYLNYSGRIFPAGNDTEEANADLSNQELLDISEEDVTASTEDIESQDSEVQEDGSVEGTPGEAVLTSGEASSVVAEAKVTREQVRAQNKESLLEIIDNEHLSDEQKQDAVSQMVAMTDYAEKEAAAETLLASKGFTDAVVSMTADSADVVIGQAELDDASLAQIEDIVTRKTGVPAQNVVITPVSAQTE